MKLGYISRHDLDLNPQLTEEFTFKECAFTRRIGGKGDRVYCKLLYPFDYDELVFNTKMLKEQSGLILVNEPFLLDDELRERAVKWVEWANHADPIEYDPFAKALKEGKR